ncbi:IclR family transcriptional regulator [Streptomyces halstedii]|uniref:IclR family transcriptional regulator n=1 Tax=Streptomyces TaxID=1883 RepID=UPI00048E05C7|nr:MULTISPECIES: IclR family transcriptional regulator [Streptomyces]MYR76094.1 helix-turn-helix domain-containing protein [Streptomyces sp. SID4925]MYY19970.1 helix-turn-helix domain-containing protein [Streptomyces sp. SID4912]SBU94593.1 transcriptional regulator, IclR family [Streptomyces sp. OspMP-M45]SCD30495.1 transcriptional regulator, IclR family [Streptomyces sp. PpalLS-921]SCD41666.1 transcriptional regulator, IclR family [Streptomyces sp. DpondAA-D4]
MIIDETTEHTSPSRSGISRALAVIDVIARTPHAQGVSVIARETGLSKAVAYRILRELVAGNFLSFDEDTKVYRMGPGALNIGLAAMRELDVPSIAHRHLVALSELTGQTATLSLRQGWARVYVDQVLSRQEIRMSVALGTSHPLHAGSSSKAILAALPDSEVEDYIDHHRLDSVTDATITSATTLRDEISLIRAAGYAVSVGERQAEAASVAACLHGPIGQVVGSVSVCGTRAMFGETSSRQLGERVARAAADISADLGAVRETAGERKDTP